MALHDELASSFNAVAAQYAAARPGYPDALFDAIEELAGRPLAGADVLDVGAGTGIATRLLRARGAHVTAVEPGGGMAQQLRADLPGVPLVRGNGNALPFRAGVADLVTYAQAWHWTDPGRSLPEAARVLRPGAAVALWWNVPDSDVAWITEQEQRIQEEIPGYHAYGWPGECVPVLEEHGFRAEALVVRWSRRVDVDTHLRMIGSRSHLALLGDAAAPVLERERARLLEMFPGGTLDEPYVVDLTVGRRP